MKGYQGKKSNKKYELQTRKKLNQHFFILIAEYIKFVARRNRSYPPG